MVLSGFDFDFLQDLPIPSLNILYLSTLRVASRKKIVEAQVLRSAQHGTPKEFVKALKPWLDAARAKSKGEKVVDPSAVAAKLLKGRSTGGF